MTQIPATAAPTWITICDGCKTADWESRGEIATDGARLAEAVEIRAAEAGVKTRRVSCTMGCERGCNVIVQAAGKIGYSLGKFDGTDEDAVAIVAYATQHAASETGQVPFREWPSGVKGHFVSRHLPPPEGDT